jgi:hypothetical protein
MVLGSEVKAIVLIFLKLMEDENFGVNPQLCEAKAWIPKCMRAPSATPSANP